MAKDLTRRQGEILKFVESYISDRHYPPSIREIGASFRITAPSVLAHLRALERKGRIRRRAWCSRSIEVLGKHQDSGRELPRIPLLGRVAAGQPIFATGNVEGYLEFEPPRSDSGPFYALRVEGESMVGAGILHGDLVIARQQDMANEGDIVVARVGLEATVKRLRRSGKGWRLEAENKAFRPIPIRSGDVQIQGKVIAVRRDRL